jgi:hypothetical protein
MHCCTAQQLTTLPHTVTLCRCTLNHTLYRGLLGPLMARYQASLSAQDQLTLRLIWRYHCAGVLLPSVLCRWGDSATAAHVIASVVVTDTDTSSSSGSSVTMAKPAKAAVWLQECVNARRVRQSLEAFPIDRPLVPAALPCERTSTTATAAAITTAATTVSTTTTSSTATAMHVDSDNGAEGETDVESGGDDASEAGSEEEVQGEVEVAAVTRQGERGTLEVTQCPTAADTAVAAAVYDPCFLLPLLESTLRTGGVTARQV